MDKVEVKFGEWFEKGFNLYKENISTLILASLIALLLSAVTVGILAGPMLAGVIFISLGFFDKKEPSPEVGNVFKGFDYFLNALLFIIVWGVALIVVSFILALIPCLGQLASLFVVYAVQAFLLFGLFLIVDKGMEFWPASMESYNKVKTNFWPFLGFAVVTSIIGSIGAVACGLGLAITAPIQVCILTVAYREVFGDVEEVAPVEDTPPTEASADSETPKSE
jgi:hypothetical protein